VKPPVLGEAVCVADALPLLPSASDLNNQIRESASSPRPSSRSLQTPYRIVRATALQSAHFPYPPVLRRVLRAPIYCSTLRTPLIPDSVACGPHPRSVPPPMAPERRGSVWLPHRAACLGDLLGCCLCYRIVARKQPLDGMGMVHRLWRTASYFVS
jgi:hypothetical protein